MPGTDKHHPKPPAPQKKLAGKHKNNASVAGMRFGASWQHWQ